MLRLIFSNSAAVFIFTLFVVGFFEWKAERLRAIAMCALVWVACGLAPIKNAAFMGDHRLDRMSARQVLRLIPESALRGPWADSPFR